MRRKDRIRKKYANKTFKAKKTEENKVEVKDTKKSFFYTHYKKLLIIPFLMLIIAIALIGVQMAQTGDFLNKGMTLKGGVLITVPGEEHSNIELQDQLRQEFPARDIIVRTIEDTGTQIAITVETDILPEEPEEVDRLIINVETKTGVPESDLSVETIGASLGDAFFKQTMVAVLIAFVFMGLVVFMYFRTLIPSAAVILAAFSDIIVTVAIVNIMGMKMGTAGIAALLMLIGYSVDTDILLSTRVLKNKEGTVYERMIGAMKTGLTMTGTTIAAVIVTLIVAESEVLREIMIVILIGLIVDLVNTWLQNAGIIRWYAEKKEGKDE